MLPLARLSTNHVPLFGLPTFGVPVQTSLSGEPATPPISRGARSSAGGSTGCSVTASAKRNDGLSTLFAAFAQTRYLPAKTGGLTTPESSVIVLPVASWYTRRS